MIMIFKLRMLSDESDEFIRDFKVRYDMTLLELHNHICEELNYDSNAIASFFRSDQFWERGQEFTLVEMEYGINTTLLMSDVTLGQIIHDNNDRLIYLFDPFGYRALYLELIATSKDSENTIYPQTTLSKGEPPIQFSSKDVDLEQVPLAKNIDSKEEGYGEEF